MKIALLSSYQTRCGIAEYSAGLVSGLAQNDATPQIFCNHSTGDRKTGQLPSNALPVFWVWHWERRTGFNIEPILQYKPDILHVQYHAMFYPSQELNFLFKNIRDRGTKVVVTFHDTAVLPDLNQSLIDLRLSHRKEVPSDFVIPFGVPVEPPNIATFGIGRSRYGDIQRVVKGLGYNFLSTRANERWLSRSDLHQFLIGSDAIVLWYDDVHVIGSSQAARTAIAARRPVFLNADCEWFSDLKTEDNVFHWFTGEDDLKQQLHNLFINHSEFYIQDNSWKMVSAEHLRLYGELLATDKAS